MVSTFTPSLNLEEPARGDYVGTWDTPVNSNMTLVDSALGQLASIALTNVNVTLSAAQYQNAFLVFTGALSGSVQITLPNRGRLYTVQNLTSNTSSFTVTLNTTVAGSQAIGLPPGEAVDVMCDGSNIKFRNFGRVGSYIDHGGSSVPSWVSICTVPPLLNCDGTTFSSATYPILTTIFG